MNPSAEEITQSMQAVQTCSQDSHCQSCFYQPTSAIHSGRSGHTDSHRRARAGSMTDTGDTTKNRAAPAFRELWDKQASQTHLTYKTREWLKSSPKYSSMRPHLLSGYFSCILCVFLNTKTGHVSNQKLTYYRNETWKLWVSQHSPLWDNCWR